MKEASSEESLAQAQWIDRACDRFETAWQSGSPITIESVLLESPEAYRSDLLKELVALESELLFGQGNSPNAQAIADRFPSLERDWLQSLVQKIASGAADDRGGHATDPTLEDIPKANASPGIALGQTIQYVGDYEVIAEIARGGMGIVFKARQRSLGRIVALKMIRGGQFADQSEIDRFRSEATAAATLDHPGIVPVFEVGEFQGQHYYSMGFVDGGSLADRLRDGPLPPQESATIVCKVSEAVQYAHEHGVIHRDIKPANILIDQYGQPRVTDFGLAKIVRGSSDLTRSGQVLGTPSYMPPEQAAAQASIVGPTSDVYSLGALLYSLVTGRPPFQAASPLETLFQVQKQEPVAPRQLNPAIAVDLETIILKCLDKSPTRRYPTASELADELRRYLTGAPIYARPITKRERVWRWCKRNPIVASLSSLILFLMVGITIGSIVAYFRESSYRSELSQAFDTQKLLTRTERQARLDQIEATKVAEQAKALAEREAKAAEEARKEEEQQTRIAEKERDKARISESLTRRNLYVADMVRAQQLIDDANLNRAQDLLARHIPKSNDEEDIRGFDWHFLWRKVSQKKEVIQFPRPVERLALSPDEAMLAVGCEGGRVYFIHRKSKQFAEVQFDLGDEHWANLSFVDADRVVGHGRQGGFKLWNMRSGETVATKAPANDSYRQRNMQIEDRWPASVSPDGKRMICSDMFDHLALWDLESLRPAPIPLINNGSRRFESGGQPHVFRYMSGFDHNPLVVPNDAVLRASPFKTWDKYFLHLFAQKAAREHSLSSIVTFVPATSNGDAFVGHPITSLYFQRLGNHLLSGDSQGNLQIWNLHKIADWKRWTELAPVQSSVSTLPIHSIRVSNDGMRVLACDAEACHILNPTSLAPFRKITSTRGAYTTLETLDRGRFALGTDDGSIEVYDLAASKLQTRLFSGSGATTHLTFSPTEGVLLAANSSGEVSEFQLFKEPAPITPSLASPTASAGHSVTWLPNSNRFAYFDPRQNAFAIVDPERSEDTILLRGPEDSRIDPTFSMLLYSKSRILELPDSTELLTVHPQEVIVWNGVTGQLKRRFSATQHVDASGRSVQLSTNSHPIQSRYYKDGAFTDLPNAPMQLNAQIEACELVAPDNRIALVMGGGAFLHLLLRDLTSGQILFEHRILGINKDSGLPFIHQVSTSQLLISNVRAVGNKTFQNVQLLWNMQDHSLKVVDAPLTNFNETGVPGANRELSEAINRSRDQKRIVQWTAFGIQCLNSETGEIVETLSPPEGKWIEHVHVGELGHLFAVLGEIPGRHVWAIGDTTKKDWRTILQLETLPSVSSISGPRWFYDSTNQLLNYLQDAGTLQRWVTSTGTALSPIRLPAGRIPKIEIDAQGTLGVVLENPASPMPTTKFSVSWHILDDASAEYHVIDEKRLARPGPMITITPQMPSYSLSSIDPMLFYLPGTERWLHNLGAVDLATLRVDPLETDVRFEGRAIERGSANVITLSPEDGSSFIQINRTELASWSRRDRDPQATHCVFEFDQAIPLPIPTPVPPPGNSSMDTSPHPVDFACMGANGRRLAIAAGKRLFVSDAPFENWREIDVDTGAGTSISSIELSPDSATLALGLNSGDCLMHSIGSSTTQTLVRGHDGAILDIQWLDNLNTLATAGKDGHIVVWDISLRELRLNIDAHRQPINTLAFDRRKNDLYSGSDDGLVKRWLATVQSPAEANPVAKTAPADPAEALVEKLAPPSANTLRNRTVAEWLLKKGVSFELASFGSPAGVNQNLAKRNLESLQELSVHTIDSQSQDWTTQDMTQLSGLSELRRLVLANCTIPPGAIHQLTGLSGLHTLNFNGVNLSGVDLTTLKDATNIQTLDVQGCHLSDGQAQTLIATFPLLVELNLADNQLTDSGILGIRNLQRLTSLNLMGTKLTEASIAELCECKQIESLVLRDCGVSDALIGGLQNLLALREVDLSQSEVGDPWLLAPRPWKLLTKIDLRQSKISRDGVTKFLSRVSPVRLVVSPELLSDNPQVQAITELGSICSTDQIEVGGTRVELAQAIPQIEEGDSITGLVWPQDSDRTLADGAILKRFPQLEHLHFTKTALTSNLYSVVTELPKLKAVSIDGFVSEKKLEPLTQLPQLVELSVVRLESSALGLLKRLPKLSQLRFEAGVDLDELATALPNLRKIACRKPSKSELRKSIDSLRSLETLELLSSSNPEDLKALKSLEKLRTLILPPGTSSTTQKKWTKEFPNLQIEVAKKGK